MGTVKKAITTPARRLDPDSRLAQLTEAAVAALAAVGYGELKLEDVAERAGVTRNLIYHYFPRGRIDLFVAAVDRAGHELTDGWLIDSAAPVEERMAANFARFIDHALEPSDIWTVHRQGAVSGDPEITALAESYRSIIIDAISLNNLGTADPPPAARAALRAYLSFGERLLDEYREKELGRDAVLPVLAETLLAVIENVRGG